MGDARLRAWLGVIAQFSVPILAVLFGGIFTYQNSKAEEIQKAGQIQSESQDRAFQRDEDLTKMLASDNHRENLIAMATIEAMEAQHKFSAELIPAVTAIISEQKGDSRTIILGKKVLTTAYKDANLKQAVVAAHEAVIPAATFFTNNEKQSASFSACADTLKGMGLIASSSNTRQFASSNQVRYFYNGDEALANKLSDTLDSTCKMGHFKVISDPDDSNGMPVGSLEVWFGKA